VISRLIAVGSWSRGAVSSATTISNVAARRCPAAVALQRTLVRPSGNSDPDAGLQRIVPWFACAL
jgi:hypothetical protein